MWVFSTKDFMASNKPLALGLNTLHLKYLFTMGFVAFAVDTSLFISLVKSSHTLLTFVCRWHHYHWSSFFIYISSKKPIGPFELKIFDLGRLKYFLGLEIHSSSNGIFINQVKYLNDLLHTSGMTFEKPPVTPMSTSLDLYTIAPSFIDLSLYSRLVGSLQYLTFTHPDVAFSVYYRVSQFMHKPTIIHFLAVKHAHP